jgi:uncharacterized integral membrane protein
MIPFIIGILFLAVIIGVVLCAVFELVRLYRNKP